MTVSRELLVIGNLAKDLIGKEEKFGGSAASIAVNARRLGVKTGILSVLGQDDFSGRYQEFLTSVGVDTQLMARPLAVLPVCEVVAFGNSISSSVWHDNGCHPAMEEIELNAEALRSYQLVHLVSCPPGLASRLAQLGLPLSYEPGPMLVEDPGYFDPVVAKNSRFVFFNEEENKVVVDSRRLKGSEEVLSTDGQVLVVTRGAQGSDVFVRNGESVSASRIGAVRVAPQSVIDHIGAGDGYKAGFLAAHLSGHNLAICAQIGSEVGALAVQQRGGIIDEGRLVSLRKRIRHEE